MKDSRCRNVGAGHSLLLWGSLAFLTEGYSAESPSPAPEQVSSPEEQLDEVIISARKRGSERLHDVPMSITALAGEDLSSAGAFEFRDYANTVPGLSFEMLGGTSGRDDISSGRNLSIRGVTTGSDGLETVSFYIDDTPIPPQDPRLADIDHIEVLRGPQGTLYGASSMGGTIRVLLNQPDPGGVAAKLDADLSATDRGGASYRLNGMINKPLLDEVLTFRGSGYVLKNSGFIDRVFTEGVAAQDVNDEDSYGFRAALRFAPTGTLVLTPSILFQKVDVGGLDTYQPDVGDLRFFGGIAEPAKEKFTLYALSASYALTWADLFSSTSWYDSTSDITDDLSGLVGLFVPGFFDTQSARDSLQIAEKRFVQEARLSSKFAGSFQALAGVYYLNAKRDFDQQLPDSSPFSVAEFFGATRGDPLYVANAKYKQQEFATFTELSYALSDALQLTFGVRWSHSNSEFMRAEDGIFNGGPSLKAGKTSEDNVIPKLLARYRPSESWMVYASAAQGFRPGIANPPVPLGPCGADLAQIGLNAAPTTFRSDSLWNYEVGAKWSPSGNRFSINAAGYFIDWSKIQVNVTLGCTFSFTTNAGKAQNKGFELEFTGRPIRGLDLQGAIGYIDAKYTESSSILAAAGVQEGMRLPFVPKWSLSASVNYSFPLTQNVTGFVRGDSRWVSDRGSSARAGDASVSVPELASYTVSNLRLGLDYGSWTTALYLDNVFDERPQNSMRRWGVEDWKVSTTRPRTFGINVKRQF